MFLQTRYDLPELKNKLRAVTDEDRKTLMATSYSALELFSNCNYRYYLQKIRNQVTTSSTIALDLGNILHKGLEMKGQYLLKGEPVDYEKIKDTVMNGCYEITEKSRTHLLGVNEIKNIYSKDWLASMEDADNVSYPKKIQMYLDEVLPSRIEDSDWTVKGTEIYFEFVYDNRVIIHGFIDRVDSHLNEDGTENLKVVDYKSSKKVFDDHKIKTPLQMIVYDLACLHLYDILPTEHEYDFILLNKKQTSKDDGVCSRGYLKRGLKKIDSILDTIEEEKADNEFPPSATPLCYWCPYPSRTHTPNADSAWAGTCPYYSLWRPDNKVFQVNQEWFPNDTPKEERKLVF